jgi:hypothetical protein
VAQPEQRRTGHGVCAPFCEFVPAHSFADTLGWRAAGRQGPVASPPGTSMRPAAGRCAHAAHVAAFLCSFAHAYTAACACAFGVRASARVNIRASSALARAVRRRKVDGVRRCCHSEGCSLAMEGGREGRRERASEKGRRDGWMGRAGGKEGKH